MDWQTLAYFWDWRDLGGNAIAIDLGRYRGPIFGPFVAQKLWTGLNGEFCSRGCANSRSFINDMLRWFRG